MTNDSNSANAVQSTRRIVDSLLRTNFDNRSTNWEAGQRPPHRLYIAVDGYVTQSFPKLKYIPWRDAVADTICAIDPGALVRGFSYLRAGSHYLPKHTNRGIDRAARRLAQDYRPSELLPTTYLAFSLGGVIAAAGLAQSIKASNGTVEALILVQPAVMLAPNYLNSDWYVESKLRPIRQLTELTSSATSPTGLLVADRMLENLASLNAERIPIHLLYWPGDEFLAHDQTSTGKEFLTDLLNNLAGVHIEPPLEPKFTNLPHKPPHAFRDHAEIARDENTLERLTALIRQILQLP